MDEKDTTADEDQSADEQADRGIDLSRRTVLQGIGAAGLLSVAGAQNAAAAATVTPEGSGAYADGVPGHVSASPPSPQYATSDVGAPYPTNDWWSRLLTAEHAETLFSHPVFTEPTGSGLDHYNVYVDGSKNQEVAAGTTAATVGSLSADTTYDFAVSAVDAQDNESAKTSPISVTTDASSSGGDTVSGDGWTATLTEVSSSELAFEFDHSPASDWVDVHLTVDGGTQLNYRMTDQGSSHTHTEGGLSSGDTVDYYFTYEDGGLAYDTGNFAYSF